MAASSGFTVPGKRTAPAAGIMLTGPMCTDIKGPEDVLALGIDKYNEECRSIVMRCAHSLRGWHDPRLVFLCVPRTAENSCIDCIVLNTSTCRLPYTLIQTLIDFPAPMCLVPMMKTALVSHAVILALWYCRTGRDDCIYTEIPGRHT